MKQKRKVTIVLVLAFLLAALIFVIVTSSKSSNELTITFDCHGGTEIQNQVVKKGEKLKEPEAPTKEGYEFVGWYVDGEKFDFNTEITKEIKLEAKWLKVSNIKYTVSFDSNGGSQVDDQKVESGSKVTKPNDPTRAGYTFVEWTLDGKTYNFNSKVEKNITLVAVWRANQVSTNTNNNYGIGNAKPVAKPKPVVPEIKRYTVTFSYEIGVYNEVVVEEGNVVAAPSSEYKDYIILYWLDENNEVYDFSTPVTSDIVLRPYCIRKISLLETDGVKNIITTNLDPTEYQYANIVYNQANITVSQDSENPNIISVLKNTPLKNFKNGANTDGEWYAMILDFGVNPTLIEGVDYTIEECDITDVDRFVDGEVSSTAFIVWLNAEIKERDLNFKWKDIDAIIGSVKIVVENDYETIEYNPDNTQGLVIDSNLSGEVNYEEMLYNSKAITVDTTMTETDGLLVNVTENNPMVSYEKDNVEGKWFGFILDLGMDPAHLTLNGNNITDTDTAKFGVDSETAFVVWLNANNLANSVINVRNTGIGADSLKITVDFNANTTLVVHSYDAQGEEITELPEDVIYEIGNKRFIIPVAREEDFTFKLGDKDMIATYDVLTKAWTIDDVTNISIITLDSEENVISNENTEDAEENENFEEEITENNEINEVSE